VDIFEKDARLTKYGDIASAWVSFVAAMEELFESYKANNPRSKATLTRPLGTSILVSAYLQTIHFQY
jgi:hypothetical protein